MSASNTPRLIIEGAIRLLKGPKYVAAPAELGAGFTALNDLIASWSAAKILVPAIIPENFSLVVGTGSYTIGSSGDFDTVRPTKILEGIYIRDSGNIDHPVTLITREHFRAFAKKDNNARPNQLYYEPSYPLGTIYLNTEPTDVESIYFDSLKPITEITDISTTLNLPPEYRKALRYNLALELAPELEDIKMPELLSEGAKDSKKAIMNVNSEPVEPSTYDNILMPTEPFHQGTFNSG